MRSLSTFHFVAVLLTGLLTGCQPPVQSSRVAIHRDDVPYEVTASEEHPSEAEPQPKSDGLPSPLKPAEDSKQAEAEEDEHAPCLSGQVLDERGDPIADAEVRIGHYATNNVAAITNAEGRFSLDVGATPADVVLISAKGKGG